MDKANVLETSRLWREVTTRVVREEFKGIELEHQLVDSCALRLVQQLAAFDDARVSFPIDPFARRCLLEGVDELGFLLAQDDAIAAYEKEGGCGR